MDSSVEPNDRPEGAPLVLERDRAVTLDTAATVARLCARGFGGAEPDGVWTEQAEALLMLAIDRPERGRTVIWATLKPFVTEDHAQLLDVRWNGIEVGRVELGIDRVGGAVLRIAQPEECVGDPRVDLAFRFHRLRSPADAGLSEDTRPLGVKLARLELTDDLAGAPGSTTGEVVAVRPANQAQRLARVEETLDTLLAEVRRTQSLVEELHRHAGVIADAFLRMRNG